MKCCTFFGHRECPDSIRGQLLDAIKAQIAKGVTDFYVGNHGHFDDLVLSCLREMKGEDPQICFAVVLAYLPTEKGMYAPGETIFPEGIESVPKRFAIDFCNRWMLNRTDTVIAYVTTSHGGAAKYMCAAENKRKFDTD